MAITLVGGASEFSTAKNGNNLVITAPTGMQTNDILISTITGQYVSFHSGQSALIAGAPSGWSVAHSIVVEDNISYLVFWKRHTGSEPGSYTWSLPTSSSSERIVGRISVFRGCKTSGSPIDATNTQLLNVDSGTIYANALTTASANTMVVWVSFGYYEGWAGWSPGVYGYAATSPATLTEIMEDTYQDNGENFTAYVGSAYGAKSSAGTTGQGSATVADVGTGINTILFSLEASSGGDTETITSYSVATRFTKNESLSYKVANSSNYENTVSRYCLVVAEGMVSPLRYCAKKLGINTSFAASYNVKRRIDLRCIYSVGAISITSPDLTIGVPDYAMLPSSKEDLFIKGPNSIVITLHGEVKEFPDWVRGLIRGNNLVYEWSDSYGAAGVFIYRQDI